MELGKILRKNPDNYNCCCNEMYTKTLIFIFYSLFKAQLIKYIHIYNVIYYTYINIYVCMYIYIYIYIYN